LLFIILCNSQNLPLDKLKLPNGLKIKVFARVPNARQMSLSPSGNLFVGSMGPGLVHVVMKGSNVGTKLLEGLTVPVGVQFYNNDLYVTSLSRVLKYVNIEQNLRNPPQPITVATFPTDRSHGWKYLKIHKNKIYVQVGVPCNTCSVRDPYSNMIEMNLDGSGMKTIATGIRNSVGFEFDPEDSNSLYFTDNGRDAWGDDRPPDELNIIKMNSTGKHYGFPFCYGKDLVDPTYNTRGNCNDYVPTYVDLGPHVAALGLTFLQSKTFPERFKGKLLIAEHGSWNRRVPLGYRISIIDQKVPNPKYEQFIEGWLQLPNNTVISNEFNNDGEKDSRFAWGRPVDVINHPNRNVLISDDKGNAIYELYAE